MKPNVKVHIGELVIIGQQVGDRAAFADALQRELTQLLSQPRGGVSTASRSRISAGTIAPTHSTQKLGRRVARATYNAIRSGS